MVHKSIELFRRFMPEVVFVLSLDFAHIFNVNNVNDPLVYPGTQLENLMETMRAEIAAQPPVEGAFTPHRGDYCIAKFADGEW